MVGGRTANGYRIKPRDHFVSLPSRRSLSSKGGKEYMVRITYKGRSAIAPVYDVGPWNIHDDFWDAKRERFQDLRRGWPEDHAAYFDGYNHGRAEKGRVNAPTAVDVGDGVWWDDLGIKGGRALVDVTFLWLGTDPLATITESTALTTAPPTTQTALLNRQTTTAQLASTTTVGAPTSRSRTRVIPSAEGSQLAALPEDRRSTHPTQQPSIIDVIPSIGAIDDAIIESPRTKPSNKVERRL